MRFFACCLLFLCSFFIHAQSTLSVSDFLGYQPGDQFTYHHQVIDYYEHVASLSKKVQLIPYGKSWEGRELVIAVVSAPENIRDIEQIRTNNLIKTGLLEGNISGKELPIVWLSYNVHGDESASTEAALITLELLVTNSRNTDNWLKDVVVILDPCLNPDGRDRYVNWYKMVGNNPANPNSDSREHAPPWPGGRVNHYLFDLNRDWAWQTQVESKQRISNYQHWMPHVHVDFHEMGINESYFFAPAAHPFHENITPWQGKFQEFIGENHARYFDAAGWLYFTKEVFDLFYPSYGDTWPIFNGAIGFTYEQGGSRNAGLKIATYTGDTLTLNDRVAHHVTTGLSTIETSFNKRNELLAEFAAYFDEANNNPPGKYKSYVFKSAGQEDRLEALLKVLDQNQIWYTRAAEKGARYTAYSYWTQAQTTVQLEENDVVVSAYQPSSRLMKILLEPQSILEDSITYDLTAWSLPYAYDLETYALSEKLSVQGTAKAVFQRNTLPRKSAYAYLADWKDASDARFLSALLTDNIKIRFANRPFYNGDKNYKRGTLIITRADNKLLGEDFDKKVIAMADKYEQRVTQAVTGMSKHGPDLGSSDFQYLKRPEVALVSGSGVSVQAFGELWYYFEQVIKYPVTVIQKARLGRADLSRYDVIVLPSGNYGGDHISDNLQAFARKGGTLIAFEGAIDAFTSDKTELGKSKKNASDSKKKEDKPGVEDPLPRFEDQTREFISNSAPGCIYKVHLDDSHPLAYGQDDAMFILKRNSKVYPFMEHGWNVGVYRKDSHISGFIGSRLKSKVENSLSFGIEGMGRGKVVYFVDSPVFRGFWESGKLILANAIFFAGQ